MTGLLPLGNVEDAKNICVQIARNLAFALWGCGQHCHCKKDWAWISLNLVWDISCYTRCFNLIKGHYSRPLQQNVIQQRQQTQTARQVCVVKAVSFSQNTFLKILFLPPVFSSYQNFSYFCTRTFKCETMFKR